MALAAPETITAPRALLEEMLGWKGQNNARFGQAATGQKALSKQ